MPRKAIINKLWEAGKTYAEIARELKMSNQAVSDNVWKAYQTGQLVRPPVGIHLPKLPKAQPRLTRGIGRMTKAGQKEEIVRLREALIEAQWVAARVRKTEADLRQTTELYEEAFETALLWAVYGGCRIKERRRA